MGERTATLATQVAMPAQSPDCAVVVVAGAEVVVDEDDTGADVVLAVLLVLVLLAVVELVDDGALAPEPVR